MQILRSLRTKEFSKHFVNENLRKTIYIIHWLKFRSPFISKISIRRPGFKKLFLFFHLHAAERPQERRNRLKNLFSNSHLHLRNFCRISNGHDYLILNIFVKIFLDYFQKQVKRRGHFSTILWDTQTSVWSVLFKKLLVFSFSY